MMEAEYIFVPTLQQLKCVVDWKQESLWGVENSL